MPEEPEKVLPKKRLSALGGKECRAEIQVGEEHRGRRGKHRHGENEQPRGEEERPHRERQAEHGHARRTHVRDGRDVVGRSGDGRQPVDEQPDAPEALPYLRVVHVGRSGTQGRVGRPSRLGRAAIDEETGQDDDAGKDVEPITHRIERGKGHVPRPDFQRDQVVAETADQQRHDDQEDHDRGVHGEKHVVTARQNDAVNRNGGGQERADQGDLHARVGQLETDPHGQQATDEQEEKTGPKVLQADHLVVERPDVFGEEALLVLMVPVLDGRVAGLRDEGCRTRAHSLFSLLRGAGPDGSLAAVEVRRARAAVAAFASSALAAILPACHFSNSSGETTRIGAFML